jgi:hypothetical protein
VGLLKYHAHLASQQVHVVPCVDILPIQRDAAVMRQPSTRSFMRLSVLKQVDLPQPEWADKRGDATFLHLQVYIFKGLELAVVKVEIAHLEFDVIHSWNRSFLFLQLLGNQRGHRVRMTTVTSSTTAVA